jgi:hypothetical protein
MMDKKPARRLPFYIVMAFSVCLCNLVLREFVVNLDNCITCADPQHLAEHGGVPDLAHIHDHEDDFVPAVLASPQFGYVTAREIGPADLPARSRAPSPLLPPPKAA